MRKRPWRIEYENAEGEIVVMRTFHFKRNAERALPAIEAENPAVLFRLRKHVDFEAKP